MTVFNQPTCDSNLPSRRTA